MYNKLFTKILDSSIWLESMATRIVWMTFIAAMDEHGFVQFAAVGNVANRARVTLDEAKDAIACLESPDPESSDKAHEGRRIERVPGGWMVLNAEKHRCMATRAIVQEQTRERVRKHRAAKAVTVSNASVTPSTHFVTPSETETTTEIEATKPSTILAESSRDDYPADFLLIWSRYKKGSKSKALREFLAIKKTYGASVVDTMMKALDWQTQLPKWTEQGGRFRLDTERWIKHRGWEDEPEAVPQRETIEEQLDRIARGEGRF